MFHRSMGAALCVLSLTASGLTAQGLDVRKPDAGIQGKAMRAPVALEGTTWEGKDSDGAGFTITFLAGGQFKYTTQEPGDEARSYFKPEDRWAQNGATVLFTTNEYATRLGVLEGDRLAGKGWNLEGARWTFELKRSR